MTIVVQKFGGTSVNTPDKREKVLDRIIAAKEKGREVVVVVSAMGRNGEPYATDTLLGLLAQVGPNPAGETKDLLASCGEVITACLMAHALEQRGYKASAMTGFQAGIITDASFTNAAILTVETGRILEKLREGRIVIVTGFQGITANQEVTTLGRGGSDTTALALGGALGAEEVIIYTDVPGVALTDPRLIPEAPYLKGIGLEQMHILARAGAKVIHQRAVQTAINFKRPFYIRSAFAESEGTLVGHSAQNDQGIYGLAVLKDISLVKISARSQQSRFQELAWDELFYKEEDAGCCLAVQTGHIPSQIEDCEFTRRGGLDLITMVWAEQRGLSAAEVSGILEKEGIDAAGSFDFAGGGSWAIPAPQCGQTLRLLFDRFARG